jgi:hypothetical protein
LDHHGTEILTTSPLAGACTIFPPPMYMPIWEIPVQGPGGPKKSRSPGSSWFTGIFVVALY